VNSISGFTLVPLLPLAAMPTVDAGAISDPKWKSSNHCVVIWIDSTCSSGVNSDPASEGVSSIDDSLVVDKRSSSDID
jgi:hypothetical protein